MWCGGRLSAAGKQIRGGERRCSRNSSGAVDGCDSGAAIVRRRTAWSEWFWYGARRRRCRGGSSASASAAKSLRALRLRLHWMTTSGYRLPRDGGGRRWIGLYGVEDRGGWGFAAGVSRLVERVFSRPRSINGETEGGRELRGNNVSV